MKRNKKLARPRIRDSNSWAITRATVLATMRVITMVSMQDTIMVTIMPTSMAIERALAKVTTLGRMRATIMVTIRVTTAGRIVGTLKATRRDKMKVIMLPTRGFPILIPTLATLQTTFKTSKLQKMLLLKVKCT